jgi:hypothetical protein
MFGIWSRYPGLSQLLPSSPDFAAVLWTVAIAVFAPFNASSQPLRCQLFQYPSQDRFGLSGCVVVLAADQVQ